MEISEENGNNFDSPKNKSENIECKNHGLENVNRKAGRQLSVNFENFTEDGKFLYRDELARRTPEKSLIYHLQNNFQNWSYKFEKLSKGMKITCLMLDDRLHYLSWFSSTSRQRFIRLIAETLKSQKGVECLTIEFGMLLQKDGVLLLLAIALGGGDYLKYLHIWRLYKPGQLPVSDLTDNPLQSDVFIPQTSRALPDSNTKEVFWQRYLTKNIICLTRQEVLLLLNSSLGCLTNLVVLSVEYSFLAGGQGDALSQLGCLTTGTLRCINILYTESDNPEKTQRYITEEAWKWAAEKNPSFKVSLVAVRMADFGSLSKILTRFQPLEKIFASNGFSRHVKDEGLRLDLTTRLLVNLYKEQLRCIKLRLHNPEYAVDLCIRKFLTELPLLEQFEYRGMIDRLLSMPDLFAEVLKNNTALKKLHFYLPADETCTSTVHRYHIEFEEKFKIKNINFLIKTCCL